MRAPLQPIADSTRWNVILLQLETFRGWDMKLGRELAKRNYDQAVVLPNSFKSALIPFFADIPLRAGYAGEFRYGLLNLVHKLDRARLPLMAERYAQLAEKPGAQLQRPLPAQDSVAEDGHYARLADEGPRPRRVDAALRALDIAVSGFFLLLFSLPKRFQRIHQKEKLAFIPSPYRASP